MDYVCTASHGAHQILLPYTLNDCTDRCFQKRDGEQYLKEIRLGGRGTTPEALKHINLLELQAAFFGLKSFAGAH